MLQIVVKELSVEAHLANSLHCLKTINERHYVIIFQLSDYLQQCSFALVWLNFNVHCVSKKQDTIVAHNFPKC